MTDQLQSEAAGAAGEPDASPAHDAGRQAGFAADGLSDDNRRVVDAKGWESLDKVVESYRNLEAKIGDSLRAPADDASSEEWGEFYGRLGRPETPAGYEFQLPEGLGEDFPYDGESAVRFAEWAHQAGLSARQAQSLHDMYVRDMGERFAHEAQQIDAAVDGAHGALVEAWGEPATARYQRNLELANRALTELGGDTLAQALKARGAITQDGRIADSAIGLMLQKAGERLFSEDRVFGAEAAGSNPFARDRENITEQGRLLRSDPELARTYIRAANREQDFPRLFGAEF